MKRLYFIFSIFFLYLSISSALSSSVATSTQFNYALVRSKECVIVGGGPVGLAAALTLSNPPHSYNVTLLEESELFLEYDPSKAYMYSINPRGLTWCNTLPQVITKLEQRGSRPQNGYYPFYDVPADPTTPIPPPKKFRIGSSQTSQNFRLPRNEMSKLLYECCKEQELQRNQQTNSSVGSIELLFGKKFTSIQVDDNNMIFVRCSDGSAFSASLIVAADGMNSAVRACLADPTQTGWLHSKPGLFRTRKFKSPATGLKLKALQLSSKFSIPNITSNVAIEPNTYYLFKSASNGPQNRLSLSIATFKNLTTFPPALSATRPNHKLWKLTSGPLVKDFFIKIYPRIKWNDVIEDDEWERYATSKFVTFPLCQYSPGSVMVSPSRDTGVVMVGDACHSFPPDIGQGVNAGFQDVLALDRALRGCDIITGKPCKLTGSDQQYLLGHALEKYQRNRGPEHKALIQLARCGAPYQYRQSMIRDRLGHFFWSMNAAFRLVLNKISFGYFPPIAFALMKNYNLTYRQVMRRAHFAARSLKLVVLTSIFLLIFRKSSLSL